MIIRACFLTALIVGSYLYGKKDREPEPSKLDIVFMEEFFARMEDMQSMDLVRLDYLRKASKAKGYQWRTSDIAKLSPYFELQDVPVEAGIGVLMAENSGHSSKMGITILARSIRATVRRSEQDFAASARLLRRGTFWFLLDNPDIYNEFRAKKIYRPDPEVLISEYAEEWVDYVVAKIYRPSSHPESWRDTVLRELKKRRVDK